MARSFKAERTVIDFRWRIAMREAFIRGIITSDDLRPAKLRRRKYSDETIARNLEILRLYADGYSFEGIGVHANMSSAGVSYLIRRLVRGLIPKLPVPIRLYEESPNNGC